MKEISWADFEAVELRVGKVVQVEAFPEARKPAYKIQVDFGEFGVKWTSAQVTEHYSAEDLPGRLVLGVVNFPPKRIAGFKSEFLLTGIHDAEGKVRLCVPEGEVPLGAKLL